MKRTSKNKLTYNLIIVALLLVVAVNIIINLMLYRVYKDQQRTLEKTTKQLYSETLKRDYYQWRDSTSTGHTTDKKNFPRQTELNLLNAQKNQEQ